MTSWSLGPEHPAYGFTADPPARAPRSTPKLHVEPEDSEGRYAALGRRLWREEARNAWGGWHGPACECFACADARAAQLRVLVINPHRRTGVARAPRPRGPAPCGRCGEMREAGSHCPVCRARRSRRITGTSA